MIKALEDNVILKFKTETKTTNSGIIVNTQNKEQPSVGIVVDIGPKITGIKKSDEVVYKNFAGTKVKIDGEEYVIVTYKDILALLN